MRNGLVFTAVLIGSGLGLSAPSLAQDAQYYPPSAYRPYGYYPNEIPAPSNGDAGQAPAQGGYVPPPPHTAATPPSPATSSAQAAPPPALAPASPGVVYPASPGVVYPVTPGVVYPAPVIAQPVIVVPPRPASCGEFRFWNGFACVDARFNQPYLGPRY